MEENNQNSFIDIESILKQADNTVSMNELNINPNSIDELAGLNVNVEPKVKEEKTNDIINEFEGGTLEEGTNEVKEVEVVEEEIDPTNEYSDIDEPNIIISKANLVRALKYASVMIKKVTSDIESSSINITLNDNKALIRLKDNMTYLEYTCDAFVVNDKPLEETLSFNAVYLLKLLTTSSSYVAIYKTSVENLQGVSNDVFMIRLSNGDFILDVNVGDDSKLVFPGLKNELLCSLSSDVVSTIHDTITPLINSTQDIHAKRMIAYDDRVFFKSSTFILQYKTKFSPMCLGKKELDLLKLVSTSTTDDLKVYSVDESSSENRIIITSPDVRISTLVSIPSRDENTINKFTVIENAKYISINKDDFVRVLFLSGLGTNTVSKVLMNYNVDGAGIDATIISRDGKSSFIVSGNNYNSLEPLENDKEIYAVQLLQLLKSFEKGNNLEVAFLQQGVAFKDDKLGIQALMNYSSY